METIQVVIDSKLLRSTNAAARRAKQNRSALIREALRQHLQCLKIREMEEQDRKACERIPDSAEEWAEWEAEAVWPEEQRAATCACINSPSPTSCGPLSY